MLARAFAVVCHESKVVEMWFGNHVKGHAVHTGQHVRTKGFGETTLINLDVALSSNEQNLRGCVGNVRLIPHVRVDADLSIRPRPETLTQLLQTDLTKGWFG